MTLAPNTGAVAPGLFTYFAPTGGTGPYTFEVLSGGAGGTINGDGLYTAPATSTGQDTVQVTDSLLATATATILVCSAVELVCDVIRTELDLDVDQVYLWDQKYTVPKDMRLYVAVRILTCKPFSNIVEFDDGIAYQSANFQAFLDINIESRSTLALTRKEEVLMALNSIYSQSQQEINSFYIGKISTGFVDLSQEDGAAIPYRFNISIAIQYAVKKTKAVPYYDDFDNAEVTTEP